MGTTEVLLRAIRLIEANNTSHHILAGFDGFVDEIIHVVDKRKTPDSYKRIKNIEDFAARIASVAGLSANIELVPEQTKLGGNGPIMANALIAQGHEISYIGALGKYYIHPIFREFSEQCRQVVSITEPGHTDALEFMDGKIMLGKMNNLVDVGWENLLEKLSIQELTDMIASSRLIAFTNWTMLSNLNGIIEGFSRIMKEHKMRPLVFLDLADPKKRTAEDIRGVLSLISDIPAETILSMNLSESATIALTLGIKEEDILTRAMRIREHMGISAIVIHPVNGAAIAHQQESLWMEGPYTPKPKLTTGAGDNFNAGFCNAWLAGGSPGERLAAGVCSSGFYVRAARSANRKDLIQFMKKWHDAGCGKV